MKRNTFPLLIILGVTGCQSAFYSTNDFSEISKIDAHVHIDGSETFMEEQAKKLNFHLLTINTDVGKDEASIYQQESIALEHKKKFPETVDYLSAFTLDQWDSADFAERTISHLDSTFERGAIGVKIWKNIGMVYRDTDSSFVMANHPKLDPVFKYLSKNNIPLLGHLGEPKNCWLPLEEMTVNGDKHYFSEHPQYHMYLHPEFPSYEKQIKARDRMLENNPDLIFIGAHLGSLEWSVDELAKRLDRFPNMAVDLAARIVHLQLQAKDDYKNVRDFVIKYQDRLIYGTDLSVNDNWKKDDFMAYSAKVWKNDFLFFATDKEMESEQFDGKFNGLKLPRQVVDKIYYNNATRWYYRIATK